MPKAKAEPKEWFKVTAEYPLRRGPYPGPIYARPGDVIERREHLYHLEDDAVYTLIGLGYLMPVDAADQAHDAPEEGHDDLSQPA